MSCKIHYHKHICPCCKSEYDCVLSECASSDGREEVCSRCWMVGVGLPMPDNIRAVVTYAEREP